MRPVLAVLAHPDDESFICGGTLAMLSGRGHPITLVCATRGEMGRRLGTPPFATRETLPLVREAELRAACGALGIGDLRLLGLRDKTLDYYDPAALAAQLEPVLHELNPAVLITFHEITGGHPDHCAIGRAATLAWHRAGAPGRLYHLLGAEYQEHLRRLGAGEERVTGVDVAGAAAEAKVKAYRAHRTQSGILEWLWDDQEALRRLTRREYLLQGSGPARPGEPNLLP